MEQEATWKQEQRRREDMVQVPPHIFLGSKTIFA